MKLKVKRTSDNPNEKDPGPVSFPWEGALHAIAAGAAEAYRPDLAEPVSDEPEPIEPVAPPSTAEQPAEV
jgi:hypothetical protein